MRGIIKLIPDDTNYDFMGWHKIAFVFSCVLITAGLFFAFQKNLNFGIDFTGGTLMEIRTKAEVADIPEIRRLTSDLNVGGISVQEFGAPNDVLIRIPQQERDEEEQKLVMQQVREALDEIVEEYRRVEFVGPQVGAELIAAGRNAMLYALLGLLAYIWVRFEWQFSVAAIIALSHDVLLTIGFFAVTQMEFTLATVAAVLMIAGYSINDTVVVFDRVRENLRKYKKKPLRELYNLSVNQMLARTLMTSITTLLALGALWQFGGEVIRGFVTALIFGIFVGTYSSVFIATALLLYVRPREKKGAPQPQGGKKAAKEGGAHG
ncbi:MAG: protein translocase subunit SecF [Micavibrio sp.]|nr:MAG: protein translocase subunit SecF [Micavibrio sp.]